MGSNRHHDWDDAKQRSNIDRHAYDFADFENIFDGRPLVTREDARQDYGERRFNALAEVRGRIVNVTFTPRAGKIRLISVRPANRDERTVYAEKAEGR